MDSTTIIIGVAILAIFVIPVVLLSNAGKNRKRKLFNALSAFAASKSSNISEHDIWKKSCIGIDSNNHKVFFIDKNSKDSQAIEINLADVAKCKISGISYEGDMLNHKAIDTVELGFSYRDSSKPETIIEFFDTSKNFNMGEEEIKLAEKWHKLIHAELGKIQK